MRKLDTMQIQLMEESFMYNAVGIDASKFKSTVTVIQPAGIVIRKLVLCQEKVQIKCNQFSFFCNC